MKLVYDIILMVVLSTHPGEHELFFYQYQTWDDCKAHEVAMRAELVQNTKNPEAVTISCRRGLSINPGDGQ